MNKVFYHYGNLFLLCLIGLVSCNEVDIQKDEISAEQNTQEFIRTLEKHLDAVSNKDLSALRSTMSPEGKMQLILPSSEIMNTVDSFMNYHEQWFQDTSWTFDTQILNTEIGNTIGLGITEIIYREPLRDGEPYYNRMIVSYGLEKLDNKWYIIKDHASSIEKSTNIK